MPAIFSEACEKNKHPILEQLKPLLRSSVQVLEIGSGSGQHAQFFADQLQHLSWQCSEHPDAFVDLLDSLPDKLPGNLHPPIKLDVNSAQWQLPNSSRFDALFSANTLHIMAWESVEALFARLPQALAHGSKIIVYGPFKYSGMYTSPSNEQFDQWLKERDAESGIRDFEQVDKLARDTGASLEVDISMPANNQLLAWAMR